jgi:hypothetical protein
MRPNNQLGRKFIVGVPEKLVLSQVIRCVPSGARSTKALFFLISNECKPTRVVPMPFKEALEGIVINFFKLILKAWNSSNGNVCPEPIYSHRLL